MAPINGGGGGWIRHFPVAPPHAPQARSTGTTDGPSTAEKLLHHYSTSSDPFLLAYADQLAAAVDDCRWSCLEEEEKERGK